MTSIQPPVSWNDVTSRRGAVVEHSEPIGPIRPLLALARGARNAALVGRSRETSVRPRAGRASSRAAVDRRRPRASRSAGRSTRAARDRPQSSDDRLARPFGALSRPATASIAEAATASASGRSDAVGPSPLRVRPSRPPSRERGAGRSSIRAVTPTPFERNAVHLLDDGVGVGARDLRDRVAVANLELPDAIAGNPDSPVIAPTRSPARMPSRSPMVRNARKAGVSPRRAWQPDGRWSAAAGSPPRSALRSGARSARSTAFSTTRSTARRLLGRGLARVRLRALSLHQTQRGSRDLDSVELGE